MGVECVCVWGGIAGNIWTCRLSSIRSRLLVLYQTIACSNHMFIWMSMKVMFHLSLRLVISQSSHDACNFSSRIYTLVLLVCYYRISIMNAWMNYIYIYICIYIYKTFSSLMSFILETLDLAGIFTCKHQNRVRPGNLEQCWHSNLENSLLQPYFNLFFSWPHHKHTEIFRPCNSIFCSWRERRMGLTFEF